MKPLKFLGIGLVLSTFLVCVESSASQKAPIQDLIESQTFCESTKLCEGILERMAHYRVPGVSIAVIRDGKISTLAYGVKSNKNAEKDNVVTEDTLFQAWVRLWNRRSDSYPS